MGALTQGCEQIFINHLLGGRKGYDNAGEVGLACLLRNIWEAGWGLMWEASYDLGLW